MAVLSLDILLIERCKAASVSLSTADVASSKIRTGASFRTALAIAKRCLCPPDNLWPPSPTNVSHASGNSSMKLEASATNPAALTCSSLASGFPYRIFSKIVVGNNVMC